MLEAVNLTKENICDKIKVRTFADGSKQKVYIKELDRVSSPTVSFEALLCTLIVGENEGRNVTTFYVMGAYLHVKMPKDKRILINLRGDFFGSVF